MKATQLPEQVDLAEGLEALDVTARLDEKVIALGMYLPERPVFTEEDGTVLEYYGQLPENISSLSDGQLYEEMERQTKWLNYVNGQLADADICHNSAKKKAEMARAKIRMSYRVDDHGEPRTAGDAKDLQECDRMYVNIQADLVYWEAVTSYITAIKTAGEDSYAVLSRRVTQRGQELERDRRTGSVGALRTVNGHVPRSFRR